MAKIEREMAYRQRAEDFLRRFRGNIRYLEGLSVSDEPGRYLTAIKTHLSLSAYYLAELGLFPKVDTAIKINGSFVRRESELLYVASKGTEKIFLDREGKLYVSTQAISERGSEVPLFGKNQRDIDDSGYEEFYKAALGAVGKVSWVMSER